MFFHNRLCLMRVKLYKIEETFRQKFGHTVLDSLPKIVSLLFEVTNEIKSKPFVNIFLVFSFHRLNNSNLPTYKYLKRYNAAWLWRYLV